ncbi:MULTISPECIES: hypothetical protein [Caballeronia]|uniref:hypothetical protein n=1 Tax=Caballeronia TaxID=1827195 RepID=UPI001FD5CB20|nr:MULTISPECIES: hypothetical protein [Caballeronia]MDR5799225.1 hypothetical protein [Caballeronia sp. LZ001]
MKLESDRRRQNRRTGFVYATAVKTLLAIATTWLSAVVNHPTENAIVTRMMSSECGRVGRIAPGSVLFASLTDDDARHSYFFYRATGHNAAGDTTSYTSLILLERVAEFWKRIGYVLSIWLIVTGVTIGAVALLITLSTNHLRQPALLM